jgi:hypothetical protein
MGQPGGRIRVKWVTRKNALVDRIACAWLIRRFVDPEAELLYVAEDQVLEVARTQGAIAYHCRGAELGGGDGRNSFECIVERYRPDDPALRLMARIIHGADFHGEAGAEPEAAGVRAIALGFGRVFGENDLEKVAKAAPAYDALYAWCQLQVSLGRTPGVQAASGAPAR